MILDTHEAIERIIEAGASKKMAEAIVKSFNSSNENLATKEDIREVKSEIKILEVSLRSEIAEVRTELKVLATQLSNIKWIQYSILGLLLAPMVAQFVALYIK